MQSFVANEKEDKRSHRAKESSTIKKTYSSFQDTWIWKKIVNSSITILYYRCRQNVFHHWQMGEFNNSYFQEKTDCYLVEKNTKQGTKTHSIQYCHQGSTYRWDFFRSALKSLFRIVPSDYKRFMRLQFKDNRILYFWQKNPYSFNIFLKIEEKKKKRNFSRIFYSQTLHIWTTCFTHLTVFGMLICFVLWTTKCRIGDDTNTTTKAVSWGKNQHFFLHLRQALL